MGSSPAASWLRLPRRAPPASRFRSCVPCREFQRFAGETEPERVGADVDGDPLLHHAAVTWIEASPLTGRRQGVDAIVGKLHDEHSVGGAEGEQLARDLETLGTEALGARHLRRIDAGILRQGFRKVRERQLALVRLLRLLRRHGVASELQRLHLEELLQAELAELAAAAGLLEATEGSQRVEAE